MPTADRTVRLRLERPQEGPLVLFNFGSVYEVEPCVISHHQELENGEAQPAPQSPQNFHLDEVLDEPVPQGRPHVEDDDGFIQNAT